MTTPSKSDSLAAALGKLSADTAYDKGVLDVLSLFGLTRIEDGQTVPSDSVAAMMLDSLRTHLIDGVGVGLRWDDLDAEGIRGADILRAIEASRVARVARPTPARIVQAAQAVIKTRREQNGMVEDLYLMQYDAHAGRYQPIGGKHDPDDIDMMDTLRREMMEELELDSMPECTLTQLGNGWEETTLSATYGILTQYTFSFYQVRDINFPIEISSITRWLTRAEVRAECADDSLPISPIYQQALGWDMLDALPLGLV
ncbi:MAG: NUDIX hydrolase [Anaerolineae bacterium]|nr:NUDIX hydrolase [Anaerolineae bacterium]